MKRWILSAVTITGLVLQPVAVSAAVPVCGAQQLAPGVRQEVSYDENGRKVVTLIFPPTPVEKETPPEGWTRISPLTEAPEVGATLGNILNPDINRNNFNPRVSDSYQWAYKLGSFGQCTWYAEGRFLEVYGIRLPLMGDAKKWMDSAMKSQELQTITNINDIRNQSIAVFTPTEDKTHPGHVIFVEYVERDMQGTPVWVYYTDANGAYDPGKNVFTPEFDGAVKKKSFEEFISPYQLNLIGYIIPEE